MGKKTEQVLIKYTMRWRGNMILARRGIIQDPIEKEIIKRRSSEMEIIYWTLPAAMDICWRTLKKARVNAFGVDISENMIASAERKVPGLCIYSSLSPLGFENESMDVITVSCAFHHFQNPRTFAGECMRVLKSHGKVFIAEPFYSPVVRCLANTLVFPFSNKGDVRVYSPQNNLPLFFESAGFTGFESYITDTVLFFIVKTKVWESCEGRFIAFFSIFCYTQKINTLHTGFVCIVKRGAV